MSVAAAIATGTAAWYAYGAYDTAQKALLATTRAYVVLRAETTTDEESKRPVFRFTAENMDQTPVRNLFFVLWDELLDNPWGRPTVRDRVDCARSAGPSSTGLTFGKDVKYDIDRPEPGGLTLACGTKGGPIARRWRGLGQGWPVLIRRTPQVLDGIARAQS